MWYMYKGFLIMTLRTRLQKPASLDQFGSYTGFKHRPTFKKPYSITARGNSTVHPVTCHDVTGHGGKGKYSSTFSLTSGLEAGGWSTSLPYEFTPGNGNRYPPRSRLVAPNALHRLHYCRLALRAAANLTGQTRRTGRRANTCAVHY